MADSGFSRDLHEWLSYTRIHKRNVRLLRAEQIGNGEYLNLGIRDGGEAVTGLGNQLPQVIANQAGVNLRTARYLNYYVRAASDNVFRLCAP
jgi:hypothetical protein